MPMYLDGQGVVEGFPFSSDSGKWIVDPYGNGYYILSNNPIHAQRKEQDSYHNKYSIRTGKMNPKGKGAKKTKGNFATAWIDHGLAPKNGAYQYVIYPFLNEEEQKSFPKKIKKDASFKVVRADGIAHIVSDLESDTRGYVIFESEDFSGADILKRVSDPSIVMVKTQKTGNLTISAVQPDLDFPKNEKKKNGFDNYSQPVELILTLKGKWEVKEGAEVQSLKHADSETIISLECQHGFSEEIELVKTK